MAFEAERGGSLFLLVQADARKAARRLTPALGKVMKIFRKILGGANPAPAEEAVIVYLDAQGLADEVYEKYDLATLEDQLEEAIAAAQVGEFDGNEFGPGEVTLYMYGPDSEQLFNAVEAPLLAYPLCAGAKVVVRRGGPGSPERTIMLGELA